MQVMPEWEGKKTEETREIEALFRTDGTTGPVGSTP
jgi:hypothetical protein